MGTIQSKAFEKPATWFAPPGISLVNTKQWEEIGEVLGLTCRERGVCKLLFEGNSRNAVAELLGIKFSTVRQHTESIHSKLHVRSRVGMSLRVIQIRDFLENR